MQQKWDQGTLGTQRTTLIGSRTRLGPSMDPAMVLQYTKQGPLYIGSICILCNTNGIKGLWRHKGQPSLVLGPPLVVQWTLPWPYNKPDLAPLDSETSAWLGLGWIELKQDSK